jgi:hypothetical protein
MSVYLVFPDRAIADVVLREIAATPDLENGIGPVWVWYDPDPGANVVGYVEGADGRCMVAHPWSAADRDWLEAYLGAWPDVRLLDAFPADWKWNSSMMGVGPGRRIADAVGGSELSAAGPRDAGADLVVAHLEGEAGGKVLLP